MDDSSVCVTEEHGLKLPDRFANTTKGLVIRAPAITLDMKPHTKPKGLFAGSIRPRHWETVDQNPELAPDRCSLKIYGEEARVFQVELPDDQEVGDD